MVKQTGIKPMPLKDIEPPKLLKLDFGCGKTPREGFDGVDVIDFGQKWRVDLSGKWPWADESVEEAHSSHFIEHLAGPERVQFFNELHRVMVKGAKALIIAPHWSNDCAYGDPTHQWPPVTAWTFLYLNKGWRDVNAPHVGYTCDFDYTIGFGLDAAIAARNAEYQQYAINHLRNGARDIHATLTKR